MDGGTERRSRLSAIPIHRRKRRPVQQVAQGCLHLLQENLLDHRHRIPTYSHLKATVLTALDGCPPEEAHPDELRLRRQCQMQRIRTRGSQPLHDSVASQHGDFQAERPTQRAPQREEEVLLLSTLHWQAGESGSGWRLL